jgi:hypothetical protein
MVTSRWLRKPPQLPDVLLAADEAGQRPPQVGRACHSRRRRPYRRVVAQDRSMQLLQGRGGIGSQVLTQPLPELLVAGQSLGLAPGRDQRAQQQRVRLLVERAGGADRLQVPGQHRITAGLQPRRGAHQQRASMERLEPEPLSGDGAGVAETQQRLSMPLGEGSLQGLAVPAPCRGQPLFEAPGVDGLGRHPEPVALGVALDRGVGAQGSPEPGDQRLEGVGGTLGRRVPHLLDEPVHRHRAPRREGQERQRAPGPIPCDRHLGGTAPHHQRPQERELHIGHHGN